MQQLSGPTFATPLTAASCETREKIMLRPAAPRCIFGQPGHFAAAEMCSLHNARGACAFDARLRAKTTLPLAPSGKNFFIFHKSCCAFDARGAQSLTYGKSRFTTETTETKCSNVFVI